MRSFIGAKIHSIRVTGKSVEYHGSVSIARTLMDAASIEPYEQVHVVNLNNGQRWVTYALPASEGEFTLNGGGARLGELGDRCVVLTYRQEEIFSGAKAVYCDGENAIVEVIEYAGA